MTEKFGLKLKDGRFFDMQQLSNMPCGAFAKIMREHVDPFYGTDADESTATTWKCRVSGEVTTVRDESMEFTIEADTKEAAEKQAVDRFKDYCGGECDDVKVNDCVPVA